MTSPVLAEISPAAIDINNTTGTITASIPADTGVGDGLIAVATYASWSSGDVWTDPAGWTLLGFIHHSTNLTVGVWAKNAILGDAGADVVVTTPSGAGGIKGELLVGRLTGVSFAAVTGGTGLILGITFKDETVAGFTHTAPIVSTGGGDSNDVIIEIIVDKSSPGSTSFTWPVGAGWIIPTNGYSAGQGGGGCPSIAMAYQPTAVSGAGSRGGDTITGTINTINCNIITIVVRPAAAVTQVGINRTFLFNTDKRITIGRTFLYNLAAGTTTQVGIARNLLYNTLFGQTITRTLLYNLGYKQVCIIDENALVYDGNITVQAIETIPDTVHTTDVPVTPKSAVSIGRTFLANTKTVTGYDDTYLFNTLSNQVGIDRTFLYNTEKAGIKVVWTEIDEEPDTWTEF